MYSIQILLFLLIQVISYEVINSELTEGQACRLATGRNGTCLLLKRCPAAIQEIRSRKNPPICGFEGKIPIVCCEDVLSKITSIAARKCIDYKTESIPTTTTTMPTTTRTASSSKPQRRRYRPATIGGTDAFPLEFPHMAILGYGTADNIKWSCGGSLISENFILTAAHCIYSKDGNVSTVGLGVDDILIASDHIQTFAVKNTFRHPEYSPFQRYHDIALIELDRPANIRNGIKPACLHGSQALPKNSFTATGWGATELYGDMTNILQKVNLQYVPFDICTNYYQNQKPLKHGIIDEWQVCADGGGGRIDTCQGDSGGPLHLALTEGTIYTIIGVTSFGLKCALVPSIYTRVSHYVPWIENIVWPNY